MRDYEKKAVNVLVEEELLKLISEGYYYSDGKFMKLNSEKEVNDLLKKNFKNVQNFIKPKEE